MSYKVLRESFFTRSGSKRPENGENQNEDALKIERNEDGTLKYALLVDGSDTETALPSGKKQGKVVADHLINSAGSFIDLSSTEIKTLGGIHRKIPWDLGNVFSALAKSENPSNKEKYEAAFAGLTLSKDKSTLFAVYLGDAMIYGVFEKKIIPLSIDTRDKVGLAFNAETNQYSASLERNSLGLVNVTKVAENYKDLLGDLCGVFLCSDGFLSNNESFGYENTQTLYSHLMQIYSMNISQNTNSNQEKVNTFLEAFPSNDDATLVYVGFQTKVLSSPFYRTLAASNIFDEKMIPKDLSYNPLPRILLVTTLDQGGVENPENGSFNLQTYLRDIDKTRNSSGTKVVPLSVLEEMPVADQKVFTTFGALSMYKNKAYSKFEEAKDLLLGTFDTTHLIVTPVGLVPSDYFCLNTLATLEATSEYGMIVRKSSHVPNPFLVKYEGEESNTFEVNSFDYMFLVIPPKYSEAFTALITKVLSSLSAKRINILGDTDDANASPISELVKNNTLYNASNTSGNVSTSVILAETFLGFAKNLANSDSAKKERLETTELKAFLPKSGTNSEEDSSKKKRNDGPQQSQSVEKGRSTDLSSTSGSQKIASSLPKAYVKNSNLTAFYKMIKRFIDKDSDRVALKNVHVDAFKDLLVATSGKWMLFSTKPDFLNIVKDTKNPKNYYFSPDSRPREVSFKDGSLSEDHSDQLYHAKHTVFGIFRKGEITKDAWFEPKKMDTFFNIEITDTFRAKVVALKKKYGVEEGWQGSLTSPWDPSDCDTCYANKLAFVWPKNGENTVGVYFLQAKGSPYRFQTEHIAMRIFLGELPYTRQTKPTGSGNIVRNKTSNSEGDMVGTYNNDTQQITYYSGAYTSQDIVRVIPYETSLEAILYSDSIFLDSDLNSIMNPTDVNTANLALIINDERTTGFVVPKYTMSFEESAIFKKDIDSAETFVLEEKQANASKPSPQKSKKQPKTSLSEIGDISKLDASSFSKLLRFFTNTDPDVEPLTAAKHLFVDSKSRNMISSDAYSAVLSKLPDVLTIAEGAQEDSVPTKALMASLKGGEPITLSKDNGLLTTIGTSFQGMRNILFYWTNTGSNLLDTCFDIEITDAFREQVLGLKKTFQIPLERPEIWGETPISMLAFSWPKENKIDVYFLKTPRPSLLFSENEKEKEKEKGYICEFLCSLPFTQKVKPTGGANDTQKIVAKGVEYLARDRIIRLVKYQTLREVVQYSNRIFLPSDLESSCSLPDQNNPDASPWVIDKAKNRVGGFFFAENDKKDTFFVVGLQGYDFSEIFMDKLKRFIDDRVGNSSKKEDSTSSTNNTQIQKTDVPTKPKKKSSSELEYIADINASSFSKLLQMFNDVKSQDDASRHLYIDPKSRDMIASNGYAIIFSKLPNILKTAKNAKEECVQTEKLINILKHNNEVTLSAIPDLLVSTDLSFEQFRKSLDRTSVEGYFDTYFNIGITDAFREQVLDLKKTFKIPDTTNTNWDDKKPTPLLAFRWPKDGKIDVYYLSCPKDVAITANKEYLQSPKVETSVFLCSLPFTQKVKPTGGVNDSQEITFEGTPYSTRDCIFYLVKYEYIKEIVRYSNRIFLPGDLEGNAFDGGILVPTTRIAGFFFGVNDLNDTLFQCALLSHDLPGRYLKNAIDDSNKDLEKEGSTPPTNEVSLEQTKDSNKTKKKSSSELEYISDINKSSFSKLLRMFNDVEREIGESGGDASRHLYIDPKSRDMIASNGYAIIFSKLPNILTIAENAKEEWVPTKKLIGTLKSNNEVTLSEAEGLLVPSSYTLEKFKNEHLAWANKEGYFDTYFNIEIPDAFREQVLALKKTFDILDTTNTTGWEEEKPTPLLAFRWPKDGKIDVYYLSCPKDVALDPTLQENRKVETSVFVCSLPFTQKAKPTGGGNDSQKVIFEGTTYSPRDCVFYLVKYEYIKEIVRYSNRILLPCDLEASIFSGGIITKPTDTRPSRVMGYFFGMNDLKNTFFKCPLLPHTLPGHHLKNAIDALNVDLTQSNKDENNRKNVEDLSLGDFSKLVTSFLFNPKEWPNVDPRFFYIHMDTKNSRMLAYSPFATMYSSELPKTMKIATDKDFGAVSLDTLKTFIKKQEITLSHADNSLTVLQAQNVDVDSFKAQSTIFSKILDLNDSDWDVGTTPYGKPTDFCIEITSKFREKVRTLRSTYRIPYSDGVDIAWQEGAKKYTPLLVFSPPKEGKIDVYFFKIKGFIIDGFTKKTAVTKEDSIEFLGSFPFTQEKQDAEQNQKTLTELKISADSVFVLAEYNIISEMLLYSDKLYISDFFTSLGREKNRLSEIIYSVNKEKTTAFVVTGTSFFFENPYFKNSIDALNKDSEKTDTGTNVEVKDKSQDQKEQKSKQDATPKLENRKPEEKSFLAKGIRFDMVVAPATEYSKTSLQKPFSMGKTEVTQELFEKITGWNDSSNKRPNKPVTDVTWYDCVSFCNTLSKTLSLEPYYEMTEIVKEAILGSTLGQAHIISAKVTSKEKSKGFRLPTPEEWTFFAKAGTENEWAGTNDEDKLHEYAWYEVDIWDDSEEYLHPVALKKPNEWGLYDMSGNVTEWVDSPLEDGEVRCMGGSYMDRPEFCFTIGQNDDGYDLHALKEKHETIGFRLCRNL